MDIKEAEELLLLFKDKVFETSARSISIASRRSSISRTIKKSVDCRTAVLIQIADMKFLVTGRAQHVEVLRPPQRRTQHSWQCPKELHPIALKYELFWTTKDEQKDLSVAQLTDLTLGYLADHYRFLRLDDMMSRAHQQQGHGFYLLVGFPNATYERDEEQKIRTTSWKYLTVKYRKDFETVLNYDPEKHLIVEYERDTKNVDGQLVHPPGLSGCGIWWVGNLVVKSRVPTGRL